MHSNDPGLGMEQSKYSNNWYQSLRLKNFKENNLFIKVITNVL